MIPAAGVPRRLVGTVRAGVERLVFAFVRFGERIVPNGNGIVVRTGTDFDDQGREVIRALARLGRRDVTWLVNHRRGAATADPIETTGCRVVGARSLRGIVAYWRAGVVVHTHGVYGSRPASDAKRFINLWHGMPIKRLPAGSDVARHQTDLTIATSSLHGDHLAETWRLAPEQVALVGLPRNDVLVRPSLDAHRRTIRELTGGRPLVVWLPTFRRAAGDDEIDGVDLGTTAQLPGATPEAINDAMKHLGLHVILKAHPLAPPPTQTSMSHLDIWSDRDLGAADLTLYELLAASDYLVTDQSSVWVDYLLTGRPMVFALPDLDAYAASRGFYFSSLASLLPGPLVVDLAGLETALGAMASGDDRWTVARRESLELHHANADAHAADRVARLIVESVATP